MWEKGAPLQRLISALKNQDDFKRLQQFARLFDHFHMKLTVTSAVDGRRVVVNGQSVINFGSANYLGLEQHPAVLRASIEALEKYGAHAGSSRIFTSHDNIIELEHEISDLVGSQKTLIGHNISQIHAGVIPALFSQAGAVLFVDRHAHTSIYQASQIAVAKGARIECVDVSDLDELANKLRLTKFASAALFVDGIYSMQGHQPDLLRLDSLCRNYGVLLYIDDAHGVGVRGARGGGVVEENGLSYANILMTGSLQKAVGCYGGFISGKADVIEYLRLTSKAYIFSGTLQPSAVGGALASVRIIKSQEGAELRAKLRLQSNRIRNQLIEIGFQINHGDSPIIPVLIGDDVRTLMAGRKMFDLGLYLNSVAYPAVPRHEGILRISLNTLHSEKDIESLLSAFVELKKYLEKFQSPTRAFGHVIVEVAKSKWLGSRYAGL